MKIVTIIGARPQFIKAAVVSRALKAVKCISETIIHTGQHFDTKMSSIFLDQLEIPHPDYQLGVNRLNHGAMTGQILEKTEPILENEQPDWVLVYGDTNSTLAGALAAAKLNFPIAHVEAGLRSFNRKMPEEINRVVTDHISSILFAPTKTAVRNLKAEGISKKLIHQIGDVMFDAAMLFGAVGRKHSDILDTLNLNPGSYILATIHRAENTNNPDRLRNIFSGLEKIAHSLPVVIPLHPRTRKYLEMLGELESYLHSLTILDPVGYLDMACLEQQATIIVTDSGGIQKEAFFYRVPCITLRDETEWVELVDLGWNKLVSPRSATEVADAINSSIGMKGKEDSPYGEGNASKLIVDILLDQTN